ncbi:hypothetical protein TI39_contig298g00033 [Zymoseptoria brevis]|uniref:Uncharacterized protein n=1 Tax=Zymoseptoria brevis TaxID=1047168 RepID=A0A0F4GW52_9PEZI|nr:hypothetical protein TI39_contig298g00033 [Zymoseptoria brevis]
MFCLRSWVSLLVFLSTASPLYTLIYLIGHFWLSRPCVYCTFLLCCVVISLLDFSADWFEPRWTDASTSINETATFLFSGNATLTDAVMETASLALSALNGTGGSLVSSVMGGVKSNVVSGEPGQLVAASIPNGSNVFEWLRGLLEKFQFRIPCVGATIRL